MKSFQTLIISHCRDSYFRLETCTTSQRNAMNQSRECWEWVNKCKEKKKTKQISYCVKTLTMSATSLGCVCVLKSRLYRRLYIYYTSIRIQNWIPVKPVIDTVEVFNDWLPIQYGNILESYISYRVDYEVEWGVERNVALHGQFPLLKLYFKPL